MGQGTSCGGNGISINSFDVIIHILTIMLQYFDFLLDDSEEADENVSVTVIFRSLWIFFKYRMLIILFFLACELSKWSENAKTDSQIAW